MATINKRAHCARIGQTDWIEQGAKFLLVGLMNTSIDLGLYYLLTRFVVAFANASIAAKGISYASGVVNSYLWNRSWTFQSDDRSRTFRLDKHWRHGRQRRGIVAWIAAAGSSRGGFIASGHWHGLSLELLHQQVPDLQALSGG